MILLLLLLSLTLTSSKNVSPKTQTHSQSPREMVNFDFSWRHRLGESSNDSSNEIPNEAKVDYDDTNWMLIDCPHDMLIVQPFDPEASEHQAFLQRNSGWYRKHFHVPSEYVLFD